MGKRAFYRVRKIALALLKVSERMSHGAPCFFVNGRLPLCYYHDNHRGDCRVSLWCPAAPGIQDIMVLVHSERFFRPGTSDAGHFKDWLGLYLDVGVVDWSEVASVLERAYRTIAPKKLVAELDNQ